MATCSECGAQVGMPYTCQRCEKQLCSDHRLPEKHFCGRVKSTSPGYESPSDGGWFGVVLLLLLVSGIAAAVIIGGPIALSAAEKAVAGITLGGNSTADSTATATAAEPQINGETWGKESPTSNNQPTPTEERELNAERIETLIHSEINERRREHGLRRLQYDEQLEEIADYHSEDMAVSGYFAHDSPDGETMGDRYNRFGYDCRVSMSGDTYATGAENIAYTYYREHLTDGSYHTSNRDVAEGIVKQWMDSEGHRKNILRDYWQNEGIGVYIITDAEGRTRVYATQNFC